MGNIKTATPNPMSFLAFAARCLENYSRFEWLFPDFLPPDALQQTYDEVGQSLSGPLREVLDARFRVGEAFYGAIADRILAEIGVSAELLVSADEMTAAVKQLVMRELRDPRIRLASASEPHMASAGPRRQTIRDVILNTFLTVGRGSITQTKQALSRGIPTGRSRIDRFTPSNVRDGLNGPKREILRLLDVNPSRRDQILTSLAFSEHAKSRSLETLWQRALDRPDFKARRLTMCERADVMADEYEVIRLFDEPPGSCSEGAVLEIRVRLLELLVPLAIERDRRRKAA